MLLLTSCGDGGGADEQGGAEDPCSIGITQPVEHPSPDAAREGFPEAFDEAEAEVDWTGRNAQGDAATESTVAGQPAEGDHDLVATMATSPSQQVVTATQGQDLPALFTAVTEPEEAGLVESWEEPGQMPVETLDDVQLHLNPEAAEQMGLKVPEELMDAADVLVGEDIEQAEPEDDEG